MNVTLVQKATFQLKEEEFTKIPFETFEKLTIPSKVKTEEQPTVQYQMYKKMADFADGINNGDSKFFDKNEEVLVNSNGVIFVKLLPNVTADSEENTESKS